MPILVAALGIAAVFYVYLNRARSAAEAAGNVLDMANDVRLAARRFGFVRKANTHPVDQITDPRIAVATLVKAVMEEHDLPTQELRLAYLIELQKSLRFSLDESDEVNVLAGWLINTCQGPSTTIPRVARKLYKLSGSEASVPVIGILDAIYPKSDRPYTTRQIDAIEEIKRGLRA